MRLRRFDDVKKFYEQAAPFLLAREAEHNLILGLCSELINFPASYPEPPYLAVVENAGEVVAVALRTPPHNLALSFAAEPTVVELFAQDLAGRAEPLPGVSGPQIVSKTFAEAWRQMSGQAYNLKLALRIYKLTEVRPVSGVPGELRRATEADRALLVDWVAAFQREALGEDDRAQAEQSVNRWLASNVRGLYFWHDEQCVSMAGYTGPTPHGIRIAAVYTPPELRRRGYASACVAALSQHLLDQGRDFCFLFTDLSNPTSNRIYQDIGYAPVCDVDEYAFR